MNGALFFGGTLEWLREAPLRCPRPSGSWSDGIFLGLVLRQHPGRAGGVLSGGGGARAPARGRRGARSVRGRNPDAASGGEGSAGGLPGRFPRVRRLPRCVELRGDHGQRRSGGRADSHRSRLYRASGRDLSGGEAQAVGLGRDGGELRGGGPDLRGRRRWLRAEPWGVPDPALRRLRERVLRLPEALLGEVRGAALYDICDLGRHATRALLPARAR